MSVKYNVVQRANPGNREAPGKFYPSIFSNGRITTREVAEMAAERSTLSAMDMMAAIESFLAIIPQQLAKGYIIELGDFGNFWLKSTADGAELPDDVRSDQITSLMPRFMPSKEFKITLEHIAFEKA